MKIAVILMVVIGIIGIVGDKKWNEASDYAELLDVLKEVGLTNTNKLTIKI